MKTVKIAIRAPFDNEKKSVTVEVEALVDEENAAVIGAELGQVLEQVLEGFGES